MLVPPMDKTKDKWTCIAKKYHSDVDQQNYTLTYTSGDVTIEIRKVNAHRWIAHTPGDSNDRVCMEESLCKVLDKTMEVLKKKSSRFNIFARREHV